MTKINKVTMQGFKSFQRKTAVPFFDGMTAIVGTNGSGKSNIQEAIQFVMGRRSSNLRAEKLEQLIFNGGENRKPAESAEVTLYFDNSDGRFDELLDEEEKGVDEVRIGRKIKRNGYSTYRFMGNNCKRSKVDQVLRAANLDGDGFHIVKQGRITDIVKQTPVQRRGAIDRISGIASYDSKKGNAEEELEQVEEELRELEIKLHMKQSRLQRLEQEKEDAEAYQELQQEKEWLEVAILQVRQQELQNQLDNLTGAEDEDRMDELEEIVEEHDDEIEELEDRLEEIEEEMEEQRDTELVRDIEKIKGRIQRKKDKISSKKEKISDIEQLLNEYQSMQRGRSGSSRAVNAVLELGKDGVYGTVQDLIHYEDRFAVALETSAGNRLQNIVVETQDIAVECVNHLKQNNIGRATFLPLDELSSWNKSSAADKALKLPGVIDYAINLVDYDRKHDLAIQQVFGDTLVAEDLESVKKAGRVRAVTLDGDIKRKSGAITGGAKKKRRRKGRKKKKSGINPEAKKAEKQQLEQDIDELKTEIGELNSLLDEKRAEEEEASEVSEELTAERKELRNEMDELKEERKEAASELTNLRNTVGRDQKKRARFEAELENVEADLNGYDEVDEEAVEELMEQSLQSLKTKKTRSINKMNDLGNVNMRAIDEYESFEEECSAFQEKVDKIKQEKREIEEIIEEIEHQKEEQFTAVLHDVDQEFNQIFQKLFEGGEAHLELEEEDDISSGLLITAQPPNKDPHLLDALSGGEKTLTAIAFMFALQEYDPSPFYIMDEIDAALDAKNSQRLSNLLKDYADEYQFIVISHNNETVQHADRAYGVSMTEGVSQIRSVDLENN